MARDNAPEAAQGASARVFHASKIIFHAWKTLAGASEKVFGASNLVFSLLKIRAGASSGADRAWKVFNGASTDIFHASKIIFHAWKIVAAATVSAAITRGDEVDALCGAIHAAFLGRDLLSAEVSRRKRSVYFKVVLPWRVIFFAINFAACLGWLSITAQWAVEIEIEWSPFGIFMITFMASPAIAVGVAEWLMFKRRMRRLEIALGVLAGLMGLMTLIGLVANIGEALVKGESLELTFLFCFTCICLAIAAYCFWCCWLRVRGQTIAEPRGFPVKRVTHPT